jgi:hypothetical protein
MKLTFSLASCAVMLLSSCATIFSSKQVVTKIDSSPSRMAYKIKNEEGVVVSEGITPSTTTLNRSPGYFRPGKYTVEISKNGKLVGKETVSATLNGWYFGNIIFGGLIGMIVVDPLSGAMYRMPETVTVGTTSLAANEVPNQTLQIVDISTLNAEQRTKLVRI